MRNPARVAVCSRSFSKHPTLRATTLERYESVTFNDQGLSLKGDALVSFLAGHEATIVGLEPIDDAVLARVPELKVVGKYGVGMDALDLRAFERHGVRIGWTPGVNKRSVAELALAFTLCLLHKVPSGAHTVRSGNWKPEVGRELTGSTVGLVGFGQVARDFAALLMPFGCRVLVHDVHVDRAECDRLRARPTPLDDLVSQSDVVSVHVALNDSTRNMLDAARLARMKASAVLVNTARGGVVDENALMQALRSNKLAGAAFDVFATEPPPATDLLTHPCFLGTPHIGSSTEQGILAMGMAAIDGLESAKLPSALGLL